MTRINATKKATPSAPRNIPTADVARGMFFPNRPAKPSTMARKPMNAPNPSAIKNIFPMILKNLDTALTKAIRSMVKVNTEDEMPNLRLASPSGLILKEWFESVETY